MVYQLLTILYWLVLSIWVGSSVYVAYAAPVVFRVIRRRDIQLPDIQSSALRDDHGTLLAGEVVGALLGRVGQVHVICMVAMLPLLVLQCLYTSGPGDWVSMGSKIALYATASFLILRDWRWRFPATLQARDAYIEQADDPETGAAAKAKFEAAHRAAERAYQVLLFVLLGLLLVSANPGPRSSWLFNRQQPMNLQAK